MVKIWRYGKKVNFVDPPHGAVIELAGEGLSSIVRGSVLYFTHFEQVRQVAADTAFLAALSAAGWKPGRRISTEDAAATWAQRGHTPFTAGVAFASEFDGLTVRYPRHPSVGGEQELELNAAAATRSLHPVTVRAYEQRTGEALVPVGQAASLHLALLISASGKLFGGYDSFLALHGETGIAGIRNIFQGANGVKVREGDH